MVVLPTTIHWIKFFKINIIDNFFMTAQSNSNNGQPQQVNLQQIAQQFMSGLQRHFDMLAFNLASRESVQEDSYNQHINAPRIMPAAARHQNFEQMQAYARDLLVRQVIGDALNLSVTAMHNAHFFLALVKATNANKNLSPEAQKEAQSTQQAFVAAQLDKKFNQIEQDYGIMCELEDSITALGTVMQILLKQSGMVQAAQLNEQDELVIGLKTVEIKDVAGLEGPPQGKLIDLRKIFRTGEAIRFNDVELQLVLVTVASFADSLFKSVAAYARSLQDDV